MKVKKIVAAVGIIPLAIGLASLNAPPPVPSPAIVVTSREAKAPKPPCVSKLSDCPLEGCGGDPELNKRKNRVDKPAPGQVEEWTLADIVGLNQDTPTRWPRKNNRDSLRQLGEGTPIFVTAWLINAQRQTPETPNCKLEGPDNMDFHLNLAERKDDSKEESVVVEVTPRVRPPGWTIAKMRKLVREDLDSKYVRITGWLVFDSEHASFARMPRATAWEVHPVTKFEVCTATKAKCDQGTGWKLLEAIQ